MRVTVQLDATTIGSTLAFRVASENMDDTVLNLFGDVGKVHVFTTSSRAFNLDFVSIVLVETLQALNQQEVDGEP